MKDLMPADWRGLLEAEFEQDYFKDLGKFVARERNNYDVFPPEKDIFNAFKLCSLDNLKVVILGQDPYHNYDQAHGLCFSVKEGIKLPPSLKNIYKELEQDLNIRQSSSGDLSKWAEQGILLLNTVLTVRAHEANSHKKMGWEKFTDAVIKKISDRDETVVFLLWGGPAQKKQAIISDRHIIIKSAHPSPLSAYRGFFGSKPFSQINEELARLNREPINWDLGDLEELGLIY